MGLSQCTIPDLAGDRVKTMLAFSGVFAGGDGATGPVADVALNAGAGLYVMGMAASIKDGLSKARGVAQRKCAEA